MSNYRAVAFNPRINQVEEANFLDNHFGHHIYGVKFDGDDAIYHLHEVGLESVASALENLTAENAALKAERDDIRLQFNFAMQEFDVRNAENATLLQQRNEAFERAAGKLELRADIHERTAKAAYSRQVRATAGAKASVLREAANHLRQLSKES